MSTYMLKNELLLDLMDTYDLHVVIFLKNWLWSS